MSQNSGYPVRSSAGSIQAGWYGANLEDSGHIQDPHPGFRQLRETQPVNLTPMGNWRLSLYDDCVRLLKQVRAGMRKLDGTLPGQTPEQAQLGPSGFMLLQDPPDHTRLRKLVSKGFTPRAVESWRPRIQAISRNLVDAMAAKGSADLIADLALPVPATLICELLGVPVRDRDTFTQWTADATHGLVTSRGGGTPEIQARVEKARMGLADYFNRLIEERRGELRDDLLSVLIQAEEDGDSLSATELIINAIGLLIAGFETTIGLIGNGLITLCQHPEELEKLREQPALIESAVEECLRYSGPILATVRVLHEDAEFGGHLIPKDSEVTALTAAANRDPAHYIDPERFDIERFAKDPSPPAHLAFGGGVHFCLGAHLARLETQIAISTLIERFDDIRLTQIETEWGRSLFRVPARIPVQLSERQTASDR